MVKSLTETATPLNFFSGGNGNVPLTFGGTLLVYGVGQEIVPAANQPTEHQR
jgi:hypothetical protein